MTPDERNHWEHFPCHSYTLWLVETCTRSPKAIELILSPASAPSTNLAWYSRTPRMRRGPSTNICTMLAIWGSQSKWQFPQYPSPIWMMRDRLRCSRSASYIERWRQHATDCKAWNHNEATMCQISAGKTISNCKLTMQSKICEFSLTPWKCSQWSILLMIVVFHRNVLWQSRLQNPVRRPPTQCWVSKWQQTDSMNHQHQGLYNRTYASWCQIGWVPLVVVHWAYYARVHNQSLPLTRSPLVITASITQVIVMDRKTATRMISIFLDCIYIACSRVAIMTCMTSDS